MPADGQLDIGRIRARGEDLGDGHIRFAAVVAAFGAAEAAQMAVGDIVVLVLGFAVDAVGRVGKLVRRIFIDRDVHAEPQHLVWDFVSERGSQRAVGVEAQCRVRDVGDALADGV